MRKGSSNNNAVAGEWSVSTFFAVPVPRCTFDRDKHLNSTPQYLPFGFLADFAAA